MFNREIDGQVLEFEIINNKLVDKQTGSEWNFDGIAVSGKLQGKELKAIPAVSAMWFSWISAHPNTELYH